MRFWRDRRGSISPMLVMGLVPIIGAMAMGVEASNWWLTQRTMQNAADSAAIAAAMNGSANGTSGGAACSTTDDWCSEARAVSATYGFTNGSSNVTVTATDNVTCPSPLAVADCFKVVIQKKVPIRLLNVVGFQGDTLIGGQHYKTVTASAMAYATGGATPPFCIVALGTAAKKDLTINGGPNSNLPGCSVGSNGGTNCNGHAIGGTIASYGAAGDSNDCADNGDDITLKTPITDPYTAQAADIPNNSPCGNGSGKTPYGTSSVPTSIPSSFTGGGVQYLCGYSSLATVTTTSGKHGPVTTVTCNTSKVTLNPGTILVVENGTLDLCGSELDGTGVTVIFTGSSSGPTGTNFFTGSGVIDISAPTGTWNGATNTWTGFSVYQDPDTTHVPASSITFAGNNPTFEINGLVYTPNADVTISGDIGSASACVGFLSHTFIINGTGNVVDAASCDPINLAGEQFLQGRVALVQ